MNFGTLPVDDVKFGDLQVDKIMHGTEEVWSGAIDHADGADNPSTTTAVPIMTGATTPSGEAYANAMAGAEAWNVFDGSTIANVSGPVSGWWVAYEFTEPIAINKWGMYVVTSSRVPSDFTLEGSDTGEWNGEEVIVGTVTGNTQPSSPSVQTFTCVNSFKFLHWRMNMTANNGGDSYRIRELYFIESQY